MSDLNKPGVPYVLSLANRLYGEQSYQFVEVRLGLFTGGSGNVLNSNITSTSIGLLYYRNSSMTQKATMKPDWRRWTSRTNQRLLVSTSTNGWRQKHKVKSSINLFSI